MSKKKIIIKAFLTVFCVLTGALSANAESCSTAGQVQYKYTASGCSYTTQTRTCCATTGAWSDWDTACPTTKTCSDSSKPDSTQVCGNTGTRSRNVYCNTDTGKWVTGEWGDCQCPSNNFYNTKYGCINACYCSYYDTYEPSCGYEACKQYCCPGGGNYDDLNPTCDDQCCWDRMECNGGLVLSCKLLGIC